MPRYLVTVVLMTALSIAACAKDPEVAKREFLRSGDGYAAQGQHREAIVEYRNALQQDPMFGVARLKLAESYAAVGDRANAAAELIRAADALPADADLQVRAGNLLLVDRRFEDALARADKALAHDANHGGALVLRAHALAGVGRLEDAVTAVESAIAHDPERASSYVTLGAVQLVRGDQREAEAAFLRAVEADPSSVTARLALANFYLATGNQQATAAALEAAIKLDPGHLLANRALAYFHIGAGRLAQGERYLRTAAEAAPDASGWMSLAEFYMSQRRLDDARTTFERVASGNDARRASLAKLRLATLDFNAGRTSEAARLVDEILAADPSNTRAHAAKAELLAASGDVNGALASARRAVETDRGAAQAQYALGKVHLLRKDATEATATFTTALQLDPRLVPARLELAGMYLAAGRLAEAEQMAQSALDAAPSAPDVRLMRARIALARGDVPRAESLLRPLEQELPKSPEVMTAVAALELTRRQPARARAALDRALASDPGSIEALRLLTQIDLREQRAGVARARLAAAMQERPGDTELVLLAANAAAATGDFADAERLAKAAIEADPGALDAYAVLGRVYGRSDRLAEATAEFQKLAERQPKSVGAHTIVGTLLQMQGRADAARAAFERAIGLDANAAVAANNLAWMLAESGAELDRALQLAQMAKARLPGRPEVNDTLGWVLHKRGLNAEAVKPLEEAVAAAPDTAIYRHHLGMVYAAVGETARAREALSRALALDHQYDGAADARRILDGLDK